MLRDQLPRPEGLDLRRLTTSNGISARSSDKHRLVRSLLLRLRYAGATVGVIAIMVGLIVSDVNGWDRVAVACFIALLAIFVIFIDASQG
ncbi:MAG: hypothetical protein ACYDEP_02510 [Acidimicrobiales bacterium]